MTGAVDKLTVYGNCESGNCWKIQWILGALGVDYDWVEVDIFAGETATEDFLAINPVGFVPLARWPDGRSLPESNAIMLYLAETEGGGRFIPTDPFKRAQMMSWLFWEQYSHERYIAVRRSKLKFRGLPEDQLDPELLPKGRRALGVMELQLQYAEFLVGDALTLADIALVAYTRVAPEGGFDLGEFPAIQAWVARVERELGLPPVMEAA